MNGALAGIELDDGALGVANVSFAGIGETHGAARAIDELHVQRIFQLFDLLRQARLRNIKRFGRAGEAAKLCNC